MLTRLGKFDIIRLLAQGSMGDVYVGRDPIIGREVAIKVIQTSAAAGPEARERFAREARAAGALNHPNIVTIHEMGEEQGVLYLAMELVKGEDLGTLIRAGTLAPQDILEVLAQVCDGLAVAHRHQVLHRDIKPSNIRVLWDGKALQAKVLDFGVAKIFNTDTTDEGTVFGTVNYMAPEYLQSGRPDSRSDLFAVGVILYEALTAHPALRRAQPRFRDLPAAARNAAAPPAHGLPGHQPGCAEPPELRPGQGSGRTGSRPPRTWPPRCARPRIRPGAGAGAPAAAAPSPGRARPYAPGACGCAPPKGCRRDARESRAARQAAA